jgi:hypothetical protein
VREIVSVHVSDMMNQGVILRPFGDVEHLQADYRHYKSRIPLKLLDAFRQSQGVQRYKGKKAVWYGNCILPSRWDARSMSQFTLFIELCAILRPANGSMPYVVIANPDFNQLDMMFFAKFQVTIEAIRGISTKGKCRARSLFSNHNPMRTSPTCTMT